MLTMAMMMLSSSKSPSRRARTSLLTPASLMMLLLQLLPRPMMSWLHHQDHLQDQHHCTVRKGRVFINSPPEKSNLSLLLEGGGGSTNIWKIPYVFCRYFLKASLNENVSFSAIFFGGIPD